ncbi:EAL domain-containing protein [Candidatus Hydrogenisulfobacillus filiaventi]|uniref:EAL domain-containing protein n=1 Tax=Candidatus Hydrogenisulfobacillus filiaventi TaxID=2707344 RepID=A0A6F8ZDG8_9FIRM|nr:EAL domain-containing protein [Candidatus Hydrogenisulfobacillus filiaventi]
MQGMAVTLAPPATRIRSWSFAGGRAWAGWSWARAAGHRRFRAALRELNLYAQPLVDLADGRTVAYEILVRGPAGPLFAPAELFALAEALHRVVELESAILGRIRREVPVNGSRFFINVRPDTLVHPGWLHELLLPSLGERAGAFVLELTESARIPLAELRRVREQLRDHGFALAVDDLGAGYASLTEVVALRPDFVKLDRALVTGLGRDGVRQSLVESLTRFAAANGIHVVAEGVETEEDARACREAGVPWAQGFHFARPRPLEEWFREPSPAARPDPEAG